jgi:hypothetical protein
VRATGVHPVVRPHALLEVAELEVEVAGVLAPDDRRRLVLGNALKAVAGAAGHGLLRDRLAMRRGGA